MTDQEINIAIAEACPNLFRVAKCSKDIIWIDPHGYDQDCSPMDDSNAMRHAIQQVICGNEELEDKFLSELSKIHDAVADSEDVTPICRHDMVLVASEPQWLATAFLRAMGKSVE